VVNGGLFLPRRRKDAKEEKEDKEEKTNKNLLSLFLCAFAPSRQKDLTPTSA
jgi:hypothetical protein